MASDSGPPGSNYFILLILTDGIITDMQQTCEAIVNVRSDITTCLASTVRTCGGLALLTPAKLLCVELS